MNKIPAFFVFSGSRIYQSVLKKHFANVIALAQPSRYTLAKGFEKGVVFYEYVGYNISGLETLNEILQTNLNNSDLFLIIDDSYEGLATSEELLKLKELIEKNKERISDWLFISSNGGLKQIIFDVFGTDENYLYFNVHLQLDQYDNIDTEKLDHNLNTKLRTKKFLCVNRQERLHRLKTIDFLIEKDIIKHSYVSCVLGEYKNVLDGDCGLNEFVPGYYDLDLYEAFYTAETKQRLLNNLPLTLDVPESKYKAIKANMPNLKDYFDESYFSIITEGDFSTDEGKRQFTEKVLKCFAYHHPFVVIGLPGTLQLLKQEGFLTFSQVIDESYDREENDDRRIKSALAEVEKLNNLNINELKKVYDKLIPVLEHNYYLYRKKLETPEPAYLVNRILEWYYR
jgi:hypothetical protein